MAINYCRLLNESENNCHMIIPRNPDTTGEYPFEVHGFKSYPVPYRKEYRWGIARLDNKFWKRISDVPFDIVHAHSPFSAGIVARQIARSRDIPFVATLHTKYKEDFRRVIKSDRLVNSVVIKNITRFYESADEVWTVNEASIETLREYGYTGEVFVMNNGSDLPITERSDEARSNIVLRYCLSAKAPIFAYVGQHIIQKNIALIINSLNILDKQGIDFNMLFVGDGPDNLQFQTLAERLGLRGKIHFIGRISDRELIKEIYASTDAVLFPSLYDSSSLVPKEASSCALPNCICRRLDNIPGNYRRQ